MAAPSPSHHFERPRTDRGPLWRLIHEPESQNRYQRAWVLAPRSAHAVSQTLVTDLQAHIADVQLKVLDVSDPSDYAVLFARVREVLAGLPRNDAIDVVLSAGTPQMQTLWVILVKAGLLPARMLQVVPPAFVPHPHPRAIKEVVLDIEGFPEIRALREEVTRLRAETQLGQTKLIGDSTPMRELRRLVVRVAASDVPVIVWGETGTGKELVAQTVHALSARSRGPFIAENCGAFSESVLQSELFGHEKGAFTGAHSRYRGVFERAHGGTLFLDEVGELSLRVQVNLLRVLQEGTLRRMGGETPIEVNVRVIAATHRDLRAMVDKGDFREDLYYRLKGAVLHVPALRQRVDDIATLVDAFLAEHRQAPTPHASVFKVLARYPWPGNVRELRSEVARWTVFCDRRVSVDDLAPEIRAIDFNTAVSGGTAQPLPLKALAPLAAAVNQAERVAIQHALNVTSFNLSASARLLEIDRNTLKRKIKQLGITA